MYSSIFELLPIGQDTKLNKINQANLSNNRVLRNPRKTAAVSTAPREELAGSFPVSGHAAAAFALSINP
jgi:hypothetical protein